MSAGNGAAAALVAAALRAEGRSARTIACAPAVVVVDDAHGHAVLRVSENGARVRLIRGQLETTPCHARLP